MQSTGEPTDQSFATQMAQSGFAEVEMGRLAESKSTSENVRAFAREMVEGHTKNNQQLQSVVTANGMSVPSSLNEADSAIVVRLQALSGPAFDEAYVESQVTAHQKAQALLQQELSGGKNAQLKAYAQATLPFINHHLHMAEALSGSSSSRPM